MKKNLTELGFILDRSGSMQGLERDTIGGFNAIIANQEKKPGKAFVSTVLFDNCWRTEWTSKALFSMLGQQSKSTASSTACG